MNIVPRVGSIRRRTLRSRVKQLDTEKIIDNSVVSDGKDNLFRSLLSATQTSCICSEPFVRQPER